MTFLEEPTPDPATQALYDADDEQLGYVMNLTRVWGHQPGCKVDFMALADRAATAAGLSFRERGVLVVAGASARRDSYCSLAWGGKLTGAADAAVATAVLSGTDDVLDDRERALAAWARRVVRDPTGTTAGDVAPLRDAGYDDAQIVAITVFVGLRLAFSSINAALGAGPDPELLEAAPAEVVGLVDYGRPVTD
jgi:uncharacterized peroxidase-related enzyme